jgi:hypothetical protein
MGIRVKPGDPADPPSYVRQKVAGRHFAEFPGSVRQVGHTVFLLEGSRTPFQC